MSDHITKITMSRLDDYMKFEAVNETGNTLVMDASPNIGGKGEGVRPMETLLMGVAGCSSIDVVMILKKMRQDLSDIKVQVDGYKEKNGEATKYSRIHVHFKIWGEVKEKKLQEAIQMSLEKYCSVSKILEASADITSSYELNP